MNWARPSQAERRAAREDEKNRHMTALMRHAGRVAFGTYAGTTNGPVTKEHASQHQGYMAAVRSLGYCMLCRRACRPEFAHADMGKGQSIKTDVRRGWPGCGLGPWGPGCHYLVGTSGQYEKAERRALEEDLGRRTRAAVLAAGTWPKRLPQWSSL